MAKLLMHQGDQSYCWRTALGAPFILLLLSHQPHILHPLQLFIYLFSCPVVLNTYAANLSSKNKIAL